MVQDFVESHRTRKRLKKLPPLIDSGSVTSRVRRLGNQGNIYQHTRTGYRNDIDLVTRSNWESNIARIFTVYGIKYEFEPHLFSFPVKRGTKGYIPDFYLPKTKEYVEIKGFFDDKSRIKIKRFGLHYPEEFSRLTMIISKSSTRSNQIAHALGVPNILYYEDFKTLYKPIIINWEGN